MIRKTVEWRFGSVRGVRGDWEKEIFNICAVFHSQEIFPTRPYAYTTLTHTHTRLYSGRRGKWEIWNDRVKNEAASKEKLILIILGWIRWHGSWQWERKDCRVKDEMKKYKIT